MTKEKNTQNEPENNDQKNRENSQKTPKTPKMPKTPKKPLGVGALVLNNFFATFLIFVAIISMYVLFYSCLLYTSPSPRD